MCFKIYHSYTIYVLIMRLSARDIVRSVSPNFSKQVQSGPFGPVRKIDMTGCHIEIELHVLPARDPKFHN